MVAESSRHVLIFGLAIADEGLYRRYRAAMSPVLHGYGGAFGYDFTIRDVLKSEVDASIDRVSTMIFPDASAAGRFFADPAYRAIRAELFEPAVTSVTKIAEYDERRAG